MMGQRKDSLVASSVAVSFWFGGLGLVAMKGVAYFLSGSALVRAAMFESIGDVLSSLILWVAQSRVASAANNQDYPIGKRRLAPLGVLFFAAFALSAMTGLALESAQGIFASGEEAEQPELVAKAALERLFDEKPRLRYLLNPRRGHLENVIADYSGVAALDEENQGGLEGVKLTSILLCGCIVVKFFCLLWCSSVGRRANSEIARTLAADHFNDVVSNSVVVGVTVMVAWANDHGYQSPWLDKVDPASSFLLSLWIAYSWLTTVLEQITLLSNHRLDAEASGAIADAARRHLESGLLELCEVKAYHAGEGCAAELELQLRVGQRHSEAGAEVAKAIEAIEQAVLEADCGVCEVRTRLRPASKPKASETRTAQDHSWVSQYR